ncbi:MAG: tRNA (N(6)-L-threonylcarbamoyladenosine(37)-C(2))-methylthiotransferase MtaB [Fusobacterium perfoetens]|uniref:tRNA (N(6)-L-threonylcarbamoyladenosine(37)-C(2))- methylthiotransferase MtaB n=1 Tax=Fusobacterium perfoetens TaxID=852 RepID=UPI0023F40148|nr:tRNA (N(6)-L-threonylcarbamoyladenosine(37)-C(2))-methylthiotransferase MtaB [Fusobacterium perfoetens]MCI6153000.1 tRNA (N(6)-L-threonylcarbamoyladenosine(37)-C(2))-methylthiotransferase MtaB [Fusobacterium perfoetens]MDY3237397.1 tRNA (N(6)-L-threonylcarbamoyladenosine(37)-C(2))-methylthiotransferase MtaB [Fusobacterium perfoetens]
MSLNKKVAFYTLGCKVNQYETESLKTKLMNLGYENVEFEEYSDYYIVNSCTVTSIADKKTRNILRRAKKNNPKSKVIVTGCYAQTNGEELLNIDEVDYVVGNSNKEEIVNLVKELEKNEVKNHLMISDIFMEKKYKELEFSTLREMSRAYIKIQDGCNNFCSYCKIPFGRGRSRSRDFQNILEEARKLSLEGYKEIILIGINIGDYGKDLDIPRTFEELLEEIVKIEGITRIRIGSIYPDRISDRFIEVMKNKKIMPHLHISLQSCDDEILRLMRRNYGTTLIKERLKKLRDNIPEIEYTADVIVGFPGETKERYENTKKVIEKIKFSDLHVFPYSERENTQAVKLDGKVDIHQRKMRVIDLENAQKEINRIIREKYIGKKVQVLIEEEKENSYYGYSQNYLRVKIKNKTGIKLQVNDEINIEIISIEKGMLIGEL